MIAEFTKRRGYDMKPVAARRSPAASSRAPRRRDRFLWDFRKTLADLTAEYHYDQLTDHPRRARHGAATPSRTNTAAPSSPTAWR